MTLLHDVQIDSIGLNKVGTYPLVFFDINAYMNVWMRLPTNLVAHQGGTGLRF